MNETVPAKPYSLTVEHRLLYLYFCIEGKKVNREISQQYWQEIVDVFKDTDYKKILIERDIPAVVSISEVYDVVSWLSEMSVPGIKVAIADRFVEHKDLNDFGVLVALNRGLFAKAFSDASEAENWLLSDNKP